MSIDEANLRERINKIQNNLDFYYITLCLEEGEEISTADIYCGMVAYKNCIELITLVNLYNENFYDERMQNLEKELTLELDGNEDGLAKLLKDYHKII